VQFSDKDP